jgi:hypothetical protein
MSQIEQVCGAATRPTKVDELIREMNRMHDEVIAALDALVASGHYRIKSEAERQSDEDHQGRRAAPATVL